MFRSAKGAGGIYFCEIIGRSSTLTNSTRRFWIFWTFTTDTMPILYYITSYSIWIYQYFKYSSYYVLLSTIQCLIFNVKVLKGQIIEKNDTEGIIQDVRYLLTSRNRGCYNKKHFIAPPYSVSWWWRWWWEGWWGCRWCWCWLWWQDCTYWGRPLWWRDHPWLSLNWRCWTLREA